MVYSSPWGEKGGPSGPALWSHQGGDGTKYEKNRSEPVTERGYQITDGLHADKAGFERESVCVCVCVSV